MNKLADRYVATKALSLKLRLLFILCFILAGIIYSYYRLSPLLKARILIENTMRKTFFVAALVAILTTIGIISALLYQAVIFFSEYPMQDLEIQKMLQLSLNSQQSRVYLNYKWSQ